MPLKPAVRLWLVFKAHRWLYHSTLGSRVTTKKEVTALKEEKVGGRAGQEVDPEPILGGGGGYLKE